MDIYSDSDITPIEIAEQARRDKRARDRQAKATEQFRATIEATDRSIKRQISAARRRAARAGS